MNLIKTAIFIPILILGFFVLWMNLTPGHFHRGLCGDNGVEYDILEPNSPGFEVLCAGSIGYSAPRSYTALEDIELILSNLDFNR